MNRANNAGFHCFDERNAGGRFQTEAELKRFQQVLSNTQSVTDCGNTNSTALIQLKTSKNARKMKFDGDAHSLRIKHMNRRITDYHGKESKRLRTTTAVTNFPAMHPQTKELGNMSIRIQSPKEPNVLNVSPKNKGGRFSPFSSPRISPNTTAELLLQLSMQERGKIYGRLEYWKVFPLDSENKKAALGALSSESEE